MNLCQMKKLILSFRIQRNNLGNNKKDCLSVFLRQSNYTGEQQGIKADNSKLNYKYKRDV